MHVHINQLIKQIYILFELIKELNRKCKSINCIIACFFKTCKHLKSKKENQQKKTILRK